VTTSTQPNARFDEAAERLIRTTKRIKEALTGITRRSYSMKKIEGKWRFQIAIGVSGGSARTSDSCLIDIDGKSGLISVKDAIRIAKIVSDSDRPDPRAMRVLTEYLEDEWATLREADVNREVQKYDFCRVERPHVPRCIGCGLVSDTVVCVPCRKATARTLANLDMALALFAKEEVSVFRIGTSGVVIEVNGLRYSMWQSGGVLGYHQVKDLCGRASVIPYEDGDLNAVGMMSNHLTSGKRRAHAAREAARKDMMSGVQGAAVATVQGGAGGGGLTEGWTLRVGPFYWMGDPALGSLAPVPSFETGEASWPQCIDKDGNVSGDLLDTLYEFYELLREKDSTYPKIDRKGFVVVSKGMFMHIENGPFTIDRIPWGKSTKASTLSAIDFAMDRAVEGNTPERAGHLATMLSIFQDMFAPKDDSELWGSSCG